jgi:hypothetical protein
MFMNHSDMTAFVARDYKYWGEVIKGSQIQR